MEHAIREDGVIERLVRWAEHQPGIRAIVLTSSRAVPNAPIDVLSDYDPILVVHDVQSFFEDHSWLEDFGPLLVVYRDPLELYYGYPKSCYVTQYENGLKIDFTLWSVEIMQQIVADPGLPDEFDAGYQVLLDKDHLTDGLKQPTYKAYIPEPPTESEFLEAVELLFHEATYVAKYLWRDDLMAAKEILDCSMKQEHLLPMLEWRMEIDHDWSVRPGYHGRRLKKWLPPDLWSELESTYTGSEIDANWEALFKSIDLFRKVAIQVSDHLGYAYPHRLDRRMITYL